MSLINNKQHEEVYEKIVSLYGIKFKAQLKDSPIEFQSFYKLHNIVTKEEHFIIIFANKECIKFLDKSTFVKEFRNYISCKILEFKDQYEELNNRETYGMKYDENDIFMQHEDIGHGQYKLNQILDKLKNCKIK